MFLLTALSLRIERSKVPFPVLMALLKGFIVLWWLTLIPDMLFLNGDSAGESVESLRVKSFRCLHDWMVGSLGIPCFSGEIDIDCGLIAASFRGGIISWEEWWLRWCARVLLWPTLLLFFVERALIIVVMCDWWTNFLIWLSFVGILNMRKLLRNKFKIWKTRAVKPIYRLISI